MSDSGNAPVPPEAESTNIQNLRNQIAAVLERADRIGYGTRPYAELADAVIAALGLRTERVGTLTRYVTTWQSCDAP